MPWSTSLQSSEMSIAYWDSTCAVVGDGTRRIQRWLTVHAVSGKRTWIKSIVGWTTANRRWPRSVGILLQGSEPREDTRLNFEGYWNLKHPEGIDIKIKKMISTSCTKIPDSEGQPWFPWMKREQYSTTKIPHHSWIICMRCPNSTHVVNHVNRTLNRQILKWMSPGQDRWRFLGWRVLTQSPSRKFHPRDQS